MNVPTCPGCGGPIDETDVNVEAFELAGFLQCAECAEAFLEDLADQGGEP